MNQLFDITGTSGILAAFQQFSTAFSSLAVTPNDPTLQANALSAAGNVASAFQPVAAGLAHAAEPGRFRDSEHDVANQRPGRADSAAECRGPPNDAGSPGPMQVYVPIWSNCLPWSISPSTQAPTEPCLSWRVVSCRWSGRSGVHAFGQSFGGTRLPDHFVGRREFAHRLFPERSARCSNTKNGTIASAAGLQGNPGTLNTLGLRIRVSGQRAACHPELLRAERRGSPDLFLRHDRSGQRRAHSDARFHRSPGVNSDWPPRAPRLNRTESPIRWPRFLLLRRGGSDRWLVCRRLLQYGRGIGRAAALGRPNGIYGGSIRSHDGANRPTAADRRLSEPGSHEYNRI